jgi:two-component system LytT family response regulator
MPITAVVVDDDHKPRALLLRALQRNFPQIHVAAEANSVETALEAIRTHRPDLVFLDVDLTYGTGFDVLEALSTPTDPEFAVIFVTAFEEYAVKAIEYSAVGYIVKPINDDEFRRKVQKTLERLFAGEASPAIDTASKQTSAPLILPTPEVKPLAAMIVNPLADKIALPSSRGKQLIALEDVIYCEAQSNYTEFHLTTGATITVAKTLKDCEEQLLPKGFFRIHRSHLINLAHLKEITRDGNALYVKLTSVSPQSIHTFPVARMFHESLLDLLP